MIYYSIIIPHYNIPDLLIRCIRSIPEREDIEIIVVDDNSPEGEQYTEKYPDLLRTGLKYIHLNKNIGSGGARNVGLKYAVGRWLIFADADDFFNYCFSEALEEYKEHPCDIIYFNANSIDTITYLNTGRSEPQNKRIASYLRNINDTTEYELRYSFGEPWCKFVKNELVKKNGICFEEVCIHNDTQFSYLTGYYAKNIDADERAIYCLTDRERSVSRILDEQRYLTRLEVFARKYSFLSDKGIDFKDWNFIYSSIAFFHEHQQEVYLQKSEEVLSKYGIDINNVIRSIHSLKKKNENRRFKNKIIDRVTIELKRLLFIHD